MSDPTPPPARDPVRIGIDVGGTFTDAVAVSATTFALLGQVKIPTSHDHDDGVAHGIMTALERLLDDIGVSADDVGFLAHGTTQATNALLEGDVATIGIVGVGTGYDAFATGQLRRSLGKLKLDSGHTLPIRYTALRDPEDPAAALASVDAVLAEGAEVVVAVEPFSVDDPGGERAVLEAAARRGVPATATHEITQLYGLGKRARTAALNAGVMPRMLQTADLVERSILKAGVSAPLMVMRCDGGVMSLPEMRHRPLLTVLSGPAAGVAGALMGEKVSEGVFLETGGTSTDISVIRRGRVQIRHTELGGKETYLSALDVRTVGIGGGSLIRVSGTEPARGALSDVGPRSAHIAGLPYACFADPAELEGARLSLVSPLASDPADYAVLETDRGRFALTVTCAANAAGLVPEGDYARADHTTARVALEPLAKALGTDVDTAARKVLHRATERVSAVVDALIDDYGLDRDVCSLVGGGGGAATVTPYLGQRMELDARIAAHSEVISPLGVALALVRESVERIIPNATHADVLAVRAEAEQAVLEQGADPAAVEVDVTVDPQRNLVTAVATGATELRTKDRASVTDETAARTAAAASLDARPDDLTEYAANDQYRVLGLVRRPGGPFGRFGRERTHVRVVDSEGVVRLHSADAQVDTLVAGQAEGRLKDLVAERTVYGDGGAVPPAVWLLLGPKLADLSGVMDSGHLLALAGTEISRRGPEEKVLVLTEQRR